MTTVDFSETIAASDLKQIDLIKELQREITPIVLAPSPYFFISSKCPVHMNVFAKFDEIPSMILKVIIEIASGKQVRVMKTPLHLTFI